VTTKKQKRIRQRTAELRRAISAMDFVASGTLQIRTKVCGRPNCRCATDPEARHGPYYEWNRRKDGRLVHSVLSQEQAEVIDKAIGNYREIQRLLQRWELETEAEIVGEGKRRK
jgi:hypothetical protein